MGLGIGYLYYHMFVVPTKSNRRTPRLVGQSLLVAIAIYLLVGFLGARIEWLEQDQTEFAQRLIDQPDFRLTNIGGIALADQASTTEAQIKHLLERTDAFPDKGQLLNHAKARALHWQGHNDRALQLMRNWLTLNPTSPGAQNFLAALERIAAEQRSEGLGPTTSRVKPGTGTAVLMNHKLDRLAFVPLNDQIQTIADLIPKHRFYSWHLLTVYPQTTTEPHTWYLERTHYPTRASLSREQ